MHRFKEICTRLVQKKSNSQLAMISTNQPMASMNMIRGEEGNIVVEINLCHCVWKLGGDTSTHNKFKTMSYGKQEPSHNNQHISPSQLKE